MRKALNWDHMRAVLAVARTGSLSGAAKMLDVQHSTISRHLDELEVAVGTRIVERSPSGVILTIAGERILQAAEATENEVLLAQEEVGGRDFLTGGTVRFGVPEGLGAFFIAPRLSPLLDMYPRLAVQLVAMPRLFNLTKREADIAIVLAQPTMGHVAARKLADYALGLYASPAYLGRSSPIRGRDDLRNHRFINYIDDMIFTPELDYLEEAVGWSNATTQSSSIVAQMNIARSGGGLVVLPHFLARRFADLQPVLPSEVRLIRSWWLVVHESQRSIARVRLVMDYFAGLFRDSREEFLESGSKDLRLPTEPSQSGA